MCILATGIPLGSTLDLCFAQGHILLQKGYVDTWSRAAVIWIQEQHTLLDGLLCTCFFFSFSFPYFPPISLFAFYYFSYSGYWPCFYNYSCFNLLPLAWISLFPHLFSFWASAEWRVAFGGVAYSSSFSESDFHSLWHFVCAELRAWDFHSQHARHLRHTKLTGERGRAWCLVCICGFGGLFATAFLGLGHTAHIWDRVLSFCLHFTVWDGWNDIGWLGWMDNYEDDEEEDIPPPLLDLCCLLLFLMRRIWHICLVYWNFDHVLWADNYDCSRTCVPIITIF